MRVHKPSITNLISYVLFAVSAAILVTFVAFTVHVDVLSNWHLTLPTGDIHAGQTILVQSSYTKLRSVTGEAHRYLECKNASNSFIRYPINQAVADRGPASRTGTGITLKIPESVPDLPAMCRISVNITYPVYPWRTVTEFNSTKTFKLLPAASAAPVAESSSTIQTNQGPTVFVRESDLSSSDDIPMATIGQQDTSLPQIQAQPSFVQSLLNSVTDATSRLLSVF